MSLYGSFQACYSRFLEAGVFTGGGFKASGDTLGFPLPVKGLTADRVKDLLGE